MSLSDKIAEYVGFDRLLNLINEIFEFYFKPFTFYKNFFLKKIEDKILQIIIYSCIVICVGYVLIDEITFRELIKGVLFEFFVLSLVILNLFISSFIISKLFKTNIKYENIIYLTLLVKILLAPFQIIFFALFVKFENYNFFFLANLIVLIIFIYYYIFSTFIFYNKKTISILSILINLIIVNTTTLIYNKLSLDSFTTFEFPYVTDEILKERMEKGKNIEAAYFYPSHRVLFKTIDNKAFEGYFLLSSPDDSISIGSFEESDEYKKILSNNLQIIDTIIPNLKFERNKKFFKDFQRLYKSFDSIINVNEISYRKDDIVRSTPIYDNDNSTKIYDKMTIPISTDSINNSYLLKSEELKLEFISRNSIIPLKIIEYFVPIYYIIDKKKAPNKI